MMVGQHYVKYLQDKNYVNGNLIYLLAAYNAGPAHLLDWSKRFGDIEDPLLFIELIPFRETRHYVTQVMTNYMIYGELMTGQQDTAEALAAGHWPLLHGDVQAYSAAYAQIR
jgi:soluble lytic murein transglycosylase-like protein